MRGEGGVAGEGRVVGVPKFHSWGKCTMALTNISSDWMSNASSGLCINLVILTIYQLKPEGAVNNWPLAHLRMRFNVLLCQRHVYL